MKLSRKGMDDAMMAVKCFGYTQDDLRCKADLSRSTVSHFLDGKCVFKSNFHALCTALNLDVKSVMSGTPSEAEDSILDDNSEYSSLQEPAISTVDLNQWLENNFAPKWQSINTVTGSDFEYSTRFTETEISRGRRIILDQFHLNLLIFLKKIAKGKIYLKIQIHSQKEKTYLPSGLKLILLSKDRVVKEVIAQEDSNFIQAVLLELLEGEKFTLKILHKEFSFTKSFRF